MKIAITFLLLGLVGSASSILGPLLPVTNVVSLADLIARVLISCDAAWKPCTCDKSNDQIWKELTQLLNSVRDLLDGVGKQLGCTTDEFLGKLKLDNELKDLLMDGCKTGDWTGFITKYGHSAQTVLSCLVQAVLNLLNSLGPGLDAEISKALVTLGVTLDVAILLTVLPCGLHSLIGLLNTAGVVTGAVLGPVAALLGLFG